MFNALWKRHFETEDDRADVNLDSDTNTEDTGLFSAIGPERASELNAEELALLIPPEPAPPRVGPCASATDSTDSTAEAANAPSRKFDEKQAGRSAAEWLHWFHGRSPENDPSANSDDGKPGATPEPSRLTQVIRQCRTRAGEARSDLTNRVNAVRSALTQQIETIKTHVFANRSNASKLLRRIREAVSPEALPLLSMKTTQYDDAPIGNAASSENRVTTITPDSSDAPNELKPAATPPAAAEPVTSPAPNNPIAQSAAIQRVTAAPRSEPVAVTPPREPLTPMVPAIQPKSENEKKTSAPFRKVADMLEQCDSWRKFKLQQIITWTKRKKDHLMAAAARWRNLGADTFKKLIDRVSRLSEIGQSINSAAHKYGEDSRKNLTGASLTMRSTLQRLTARTKRFWIEVRNRVRKSHKAVTAYSARSMSDLSKLRSTPAFRSTALGVSATLLLAPILLIAYRAFETQELSRVDRAWQILGQRSPGNAGKRWALHYLNTARWPFKTRANLSGIDLSAKTHDGAVYLRAMQLPSAYLSGAQLSQVDLAQSDLTHANLSGANLTGASLTGAKLQDADLTDAILNSAKLSGASLISIQATTVDARLADMAGADLSRANLLSADLNGANLDSAILDDANLWSANLSYSRLDSASLIGTSLVSADLTNVSLTHADLTEANLTDANLSGASFVTLVDEIQIGGKAFGLSQDQLNDAWAYADSPPHLPPDLCVAVFERVIATGKLTAKGLPKGYRCGPAGIPQDPGPEVGPQAARGKHFSRG